MDLFDFNYSNNNELKPLAERMRPDSLEEFVGQQHIIKPGTLLFRAIMSDRVNSCIFYGPPGIGKTTLANIIANTTKANFVKLNAVSSGVSDVKKVIEDAKNQLRMYGKKTYLMLDECHRWSKTQSDSMLGAIEDGSIIFIGSTTENPYANMTRAIVSRCTIYEFLPLSNDDVVNALNRAITLDKGLGNMNVVADQGALEFLADRACGDLRTAYNALELASLTTPASKDGKIHITVEVASQSIQKKALSVNDETYYDMLSAFCKSLRGSSVEGALYWSTRLIEAGCDPLLILRRTVVHASEDIGLADSNALVVATSALTAYLNIGYPEGLIPMTHAIMYVCRAPKSNAVIMAKDRAIQDVQTIRDDNVPHYLRDRTYTRTVDDGSKYKYPHDYGGYVEQEYLPKSISNHKYITDDEELIIQQGRSRLKK